MNQTMPIVKVKDLGIGIGTFYRWTRQLDIRVRDYHHLEPVNA